MVSNGLLSKMWWLLRRSLYILQRLLFHIRTTVRNGNKQEGISVEDVEQLYTEDTVIV